MYPKIINSGIYVPHTQLKFGSDRAWTNYIRYVIVVDNVSADTADAFGNIRKHDAPNLPRWFNFRRQLIYIYIRNSMTIKQICSTTCCE